MPRVQSTSSFNSSVRSQIKLRILTLVVNTANLINERTTRSVSISHAVMAPIALFTTYIFLGCHVVGAFRKKFASIFLELYSLLSCIGLNINLSLTVFLDIMYRDDYESQKVRFLLNAMLPMVCALLVSMDVIQVCFSKREPIRPLPPSLRNSFEEDNFEIPESASSHGSPSTQVSSSSPPKLKVQQLNMVLISEDSHIFNEQHK